MQELILLKSQLTLSVSVIMLECCLISSHIHTRYYYYEIMNAREKNFVMIHLNSK